jgi:hypothetical protein
VLAEDSTMTKLTDEQQALLEEQRAWMPVDPGLSMERRRRTLESIVRGWLEVGEATELVTAVRSAVERGIEPETARAAVDLLVEAEWCQTGLGTMATGPGEGRYSMLQLRTLEFARAWLLTVLSEDEAQVAEARKLHAKVEGDAFYDERRRGKHLEALRRRLTPSRPE